MQFFTEAKEDLPSFPWENVSQLRSVRSDLAEWVYNQNFPILLEVSKSGGRPSMRERYRFGFVAFAYGLFQKEPPLEEMTSAFSTIFGSTTALFGPMRCPVQYLVSENAPLPSEEQLSEESEIASRLNSLLISFYMVSVTLDASHYPHIEVSGFDLPNPQPDRAGEKEWSKKLLDLKHTGVYLADILGWYEDDSVKKLLLEAAEQFRDTTEKYLFTAHWAHRPSQLKAHRGLLYSFLVSGNRDLLKDARKLPASGLDTAEQAFFHHVLDSALAESDPERCRFHIRYLTPYRFQV